MKKYLAMALLLTASVNVYAVDGGAVVGGGLGGAAGAAIGYNLGGQGGAILGGALGGATGAAVGTSKQVQAAPAQDAGYDDEDRHHDHGRHRGHDKKHHNED